MRAIGERVIEDRIVRQLEVLRCRDAAVLRRCSIGLGFGSIDLLLVPRSGRYRLVLIEAKRSVAPDATARVVGQLLMYYAGSLKLGVKSIDRLRKYYTDNRTQARSRMKKSLRALAGGTLPTVESWNLLKHGVRLSPRQVALFIATDAPPSRTLKAVLGSLARHHGVRIGTIHAGAGRLIVWKPA